MGPPFLGLRWMVVVQDTDMVEKVKAGKRANRPGADRRETRLPHESICNLSGLVFIVSLFMDFVVNKSYKRK